ncbi:MAG: hypothetical protein M1546_06100 [Chloroflexi bacterium]|nr:hypothetical protein [Chloroflexota bacterium]
MNGPQQIVILFIEVAVPFFLTVTRRNRWLLAWICFVVAVNILDTALFVNLPAARVAGLLLIPNAMSVLRHTLRTRAGSALVVQFAYLVFLGFVFGFLLPWPTGEFQRGFNQIASGRTVIYLVRTAADLSIALFVAQQIVRLMRPDLIIRYVLVGTTAAALAGVVEWLTRFDLYGMITGLRSLSLEYRMRGFNYEPRGLGLIAAHGFLFSILMFSYQRSRKWVIVLIFHAAALMFAGSTSALLVLTAGACVLFWSSRQARPFFSIVALLGLVALPGLVALNAPQLQSYADDVVLRLVTGAIGVESGGLIDNVAFRMGVFNGSALLFLVDNPLHAIIGTGPGLVTLPATLYMPQSVSYDWLVQLGAGINSPPTIGALLELSNTGLIGWVLWAIFLLSSFRSFRYLAEHSKPNVAWSIAGTAFLVAAAIYCLEASPLSSIWPVFVGSGLAAAYQAQKHKAQSIARQEARVSLNLAQNDIPVAL